MALGHDAPAGPDVPVENAAWSMPQVQEEGGPKAASIAEGELLPPRRRRERDDDVRGGAVDAIDQTPPAFSVAEVRTRGVGARNAQSSIQPPRAARPLERLVTPAAQEEHRTTVVPSNGENRVKQIGANTIRTEPPQTHPGRERSRIGFEDPEVHALEHAQEHTIALRAFQIASDDGRHPTESSQPERTRESVFELDRGWRVKAHAAQMDVGVHQTSTPGRDRDFDH